MVVKHVLEPWNFVEQDEPNPGSTEQIIYHSYHGRSAACPLDQFRQIWIVSHSGLVSGERTTGEQYLHSPVLDQAIAVVSRWRGRPEWGIHVSISNRRSAQM